MSAQVIALHQHAPELDCPSSRHSAVELHHQAALRLSRRSQLKMKAVQSRPVNTRMWRSATNDICVAQHSSSQALALNDNDASHKISCRALSNSNPPMMQPTYDCNVSRTNTLPTPEKPHYMLPRRLLHVLPTWPVDGVVSSSMGGTLCI